MRDFTEARRAFRDLGKKHFAGKLSRADYRLEVMGMIVLDDDGERWRIHPDSGRWQRMQENGEWLNDNPDKRERGEAIAESDDYLPYEVRQIPVELVVATALVLLVLIGTSVLVYSLANATLP